MSAQINLYNPRYRKQRELLALGPVLAVALAIYLLLAAAAGWASRDAAARQAMAAAADAQLKAVKAQVEAAKQVTARKPSAQVIAEMENAEAQLQRREDVLRLLEGGAIGTTKGFSDHFRALARQAPEGLWLTGFSISAGGGDISISGSTLYAAAVPEYIGRLGREPVFQGKSFAALTMQRPNASPAPAGVASADGSGVGALIGALAGAGVKPGPTKASSAAPAPAALQSIDFVLLPKVATAVEVKR